MDGTPSQSSPHPGSVVWPKCGFPECEINLLRHVHVVYQILSWAFCKNEMLNYRDVPGNEGRKRDDTFIKIVINTIYTVQTLMENKTNLIITVNDKHKIGN